MAFQKYLFALFGMLAIGIQSASCDVRLIRDGQLGEYNRAGRAAVAVTADNKIFLAASLHMPEEENPLGKIYLWSSVNEGESWSSALKISDSPFEDVGPGLCVTKNGALLANYSTSLKWAFSTTIQDPTHQAWWEKVKGMSLVKVNNHVNFWMCRSVDGGLTWSEPYELPCNPLSGAEQLSDGSLFIFGQRNTDSMRQMIEGERNNFIATGAISADDGLSWKRLKDLATVEGDNLISNAVQDSGYAENAQKQIVVITRNNASSGGTELKQFEIPEAERTKWSSAHKVGSARSFHLTSLKDNRLLMSYVDTMSPEKISSKISDDGGKTWAEAGAIVTGKNIIRDGFSSAGLNDGSVVTVWFEDLTQGKSRLHYKVWKF